MHYLFPARLRKPLWIKDMKDKKIDFVRGTLCYRSWAATVQRAGLYKKNATDGKKRTFRNQVISFLQENIIPKYIIRCTEEQHYKNIEILIKYANEVGKNVLKKTGYKYGVAQKLINLTLKYYWCLDWIEEPPHCPVDRNVIAEIDQTNLPELNWTQITKKAEYEKIINEIKILAKDRSISVWELNNY